ncbi:homoserine O-succinyltransferase [Campylobacter sp.]|uniref:homoserine O-succinyltransferase n=1 Tax=Campylobacter sp. TaxID=205 RepID=UPI0026DC9642|nr:homoserine O-succinyltransferase [Campylobacter sp.]MDO4674349.1 homoserine O-succinyltransferase [Campylobacter sp.]
MPLIIPKDIPAFESLKNNVFIMDTQRANTQKIRPLEIVILNLMPTKIETENQLLSLLANSPLQINITLIATQSYVGKNTPMEHLDKFYKGINNFKDKKFDGAIVTGAPVELLEFEEVKYWDELKDIFTFLRQSVTSTMYICWGAMGALYYFYGIGKYALREKSFGVFEHEVVKQDLILSNLNEHVLMPHARNAHIDEEALKRNKELQILLRNDEVGISMLRDRQDVFILGHLEYFRETLELEYIRDFQLNHKIKRPKNYYKNDGSIKYNWRSDAGTIFSNWLNYYVYQTTPFVL